MKPRINVHLTEQIAERLAAAAKRSGASKTAIVEAALARFFDVDGEANDNGVLLRHLNSTSRQLEQLDLEVKIVSETVALHARYLLTVTPPLRHADQRAACALGLDRFEVFASQVGRRVQLGAPLMRETMARVSGSGPKAFAPDLEEDPLPSAEVADREPGLSAAPIVDEGPEFSTAAQEDGNMGFPAQGCHPSRSPIPHSKARAAETVAAPQPSATTSWAMSRQEKWRLIAFVFLPFATGYYLSYLYRTISALISTRLVSDLALQAADLGFLTSVYFLAFAAVQLPVGILLDRYGPRRIQSALLLLAAGGAALFGISEAFASLAVARVLIGLGVAASLTAGVKAVVLWFPKERIALANGGMVMFGALGAVTATAPAEQLLAWIGWRGLFELLAVVTAGCAALIYLVVPEGASAAGAPKGPTSVSLRTIYMDPRFWRLAPLAATCVGTAWSLQGLWAAPWLTDVEGLDRPAMVRHLFVMALALSAGALALGLTADRLGRYGVGPRVLSSVVTVAFIAVQVALILRVPFLSYLLWGVIAAVGATTVLGFAILAEYFPKELAGRATAALGVFYIGGTFSLQYLTGLIVQLWRRAASPMHWAPPQNCGP